MATYVNHIDLLETHSTWRRYDRGLRELTLLEAPKSIIQGYKFKAAKDCFLAFADLMLDGKLKVAPFHEIIASNFEAIALGECQRLIVSCPPRSGKSMLSQVFVAWLLGRDQETQHIIASYGAQLSNRFHRGIVGYLKHKHFKSVFPSWLGFEPDSKYDMRGGGYILSTSVGGVLTGFTAGSKAEDSPGVGALVIDDPLKSSDSRKALDNLESFWGEQASTRRTNRWAQVLIGTRFHERDLHGVLVDSDGLWDEKDNPDGWRWINISGLCENEAEDPLGRKNGESHWPTNPVFSVDMLQSQKRSMGSNAFAALYQGHPTAAEGSIIKAGWLDRVIPEDAPTKFDITYLAMDTAFSEKQEADESVIAVMGYRKDDPEIIWVREIIHGRWSFPDLLAMVEQTQKYYRAKFMCIEQAASGQSLIQILERETQISLHKFKPLKSKTIRLQTVAPLLEAGRVKFIDGTWTDPFFKELTAFPHVPHDDWTDAVVWGLTHYLFSMDGGGADYADAFARRGHSSTTRASLFGEFTELSKEHNSRSRGRRSLFDRGNSGDAYRLGSGEGSSLRRSNDLKFDNPL
jgi:predicted phage terminase large subunit-like protein